MEEKQWSSDLIGFVKEGKFGGFSVSFLESQIDELKKYINDRGYVNLDVKLSKNGKPICSVLKPLSENRPASPTAGKPATPVAVTDDLPF